MTKAIYVCYYDGKYCEKAIPKFDESGVLIEEPHDEIMKKYEGIIAKDQIENSWDICDKCDRNGCISGLCCGKIKLNNYIKFEIID